MKNLNLINQSEIPMPKAWIKEWMKALVGELKKNKIVIRQKELAIIFLNPNAAKETNQEYRGKNYATDVLSFEGEGEYLGELVICPHVLKAQAKENSHSFKAELGYMLIHGVLHLLGFDHEKSKKEAAKMFQIQDQVFDRLSDKFEI